MDMAEKDDTEGRCPACRLTYDKEKIVGMAANCERLLFCQQSYLSALTYALINVCPFLIVVNSHLQIGC